MKRDTHLNVIGPEIRRIRKQRGWSQSKLALRLQSVGWQISRSALAKIECRIVWVGDFELLYFVNVFGVGIGELFPRNARRAPVETMIAKLSRGAGGGAVAHVGDTYHERLPQRARARSAFLLFPPCRATTVPPARAREIWQRRTSIRRMKNERIIPQQATYTAKEAAAYLKVSERQIRNFIARKLLRKSKAQARTLIPGEDVETLLARTS